MIRISRPVFEIWNTPKHLVQSIHPVTRIFCLLSWSSTTVNCSIFVAGWMLAHMHLPGIWVRKPGPVVTPSNPPDKILRIRVICICRCISTRPSRNEGGLSGGFAPYKKTSLLNNFVPFLKRTRRKRYICFCSCDTSPKLSGATWVIRQPLTQRRSGSALQYNRTWTWSRMGSPTADYK